MPDPELGTPFDRHTADRDEYRRRVASIVRVDTAAGLTEEELVGVEAARLAGTSSLACADAILAKRVAIADQEEALPGDVACSSCGTRYGQRFSHHGGICVRVSGKMICARCAIEDDSAPEPEDYDGFGKHPIVDHESPAFRAAMIDSGFGRKLR